MPIMFAIFAALFALIAALWRWAVRRILSFERYDVLDTPAPGNRIQVDGVWLHYVERGSGDPLILLHGLGASTFSWRHNIGPLSGRFRVIAIDALGFGSSQRLADTDYSLRAGARRVVHLMDALGIDRAAVAGHSLGGAVAMHIAADYPERVERLILIDSATQRETRFFARSRFFSAMNPITYAFIYNSRWCRRKLLESIYYDRSKVTDDVVDGYFAPGYFRGHHEARSRLARDMARDHNPPLHVIRAPTLIIWGKHDRLLPPSRGRWLAASLPNAQLVVLERAAHQTPEEMPDEVNRAIAEFAGRPLRMQARA